MLSLTSHPTPRCLPPHAPSPTTHAPLCTTPCPAVYTTQCPAVYHPMPAAHHPMPRYLTPYAPRLRFCPAHSAPHTNIWCSEGGARCRRERELKSRLQARVKGGALGHSLLGRRPRLFFGLVIIFSAFMISAASPKHPVTAALRVRLTQERPAQAYIS